MTERGRHYASTLRYRFLTANPIALAVMATCALVTTTAMLALVLL